MEIEIQSQHTEVLPAWRTVVEATAEKLASRFPEMLRLHVTFRHGGHHQHGDEEVHVLANTAGKVFSVTKRKELPLEALHASLDAIEREIVTHHQERKNHRPAV